IPTRTSPLGGVTPLRGAETCHPELPDGCEMAGAVDGELARRHDRAADFSGEIFEPGGKIDRGPDTSEIQPINCADVPIKNPSYVKRQTEPDAFLTRDSTRGGHRVNALAHVQRGGQGPLPDR